MNEQGEIILEDRLPEPRRTLDAEPFWQGVEVGELRYQHCASCEAVVWPARSYCPYCDQRTLHWRQSCGEGEIYSFSTVMRPPTPAWKDKAPYTVGLVRMAEGYYFFTEIDEPWEGIKVGQEVHVTFPARDVPLPIFKYRKR